MLLVILSRVKSGSNLGVLPLLHGEKSLQYLKKLRHDPYLAIWLAGFDEDGRWNKVLAEKSAESLQLKPQAAHRPGMRPKARTPRIPPAPVHPMKTPSPPVIAVQQPAPVQMARAVIPPHPESAHRQFAFWKLSQEEEQQARGFLQFYQVFIQEGPHLEWEPLMNMPTPDSPFIAPIDIASLQSPRRLTGNVITTFLNAMQEKRMPDRQWEPTAVLSSRFYVQLMADDSKIPELTNTYHFLHIQNEMDQHGAALLDKDIIIPIFLFKQEHWIIAIISPQSLTVLLINSIQDSADERIQRVLERWLGDVHAHFGKPFELNDWDFFSNRTLPNNRPIQRDETSCGVFVSLTAANWIWYRCLPTTEDWTQKNVPELRLYMLYQLWLLRENGQANERKLMDGLEEKHGEIFEV